MRIRDWSSDVCSSDLTGTVQLPIVDAIRKREELEKAVETYGIASELTMAVGDGANDILMMQAAGLGVTYHATQKARAAADAEIVHGALSGLLYAQGIGRGDWVQACEKTARERKSQTLNSWLLFADSMEF